MTAEVKQLAEWQLVQGRLRTSHADDDAGAGKVPAEDRLHGRIRAPDRFKGVVHSVAAGDRLDRLDRITLGRVDGMSGAELARPLQFARIDIDADDRRRPSQTTAHDHRVPNPAAAKD